MSNALQSKIIKAATNKLCEIMADTGHACSPSSECWKTASCPSTQDLEYEIKKAMR